MKTSKDNKIEEMFDLDKESIYDDALHHCGMSVYYERKGDQRNWKEHLNKFFEACRVHRLLYGECIADKVVADSLRERVKRVNAI